MNTFRTSKLFRVVPKVGYPHAVFKWVTNNVPLSDGIDVIIFYIFDSFGQLRIRFEGSWAILKITLNLTDML